METWIILAVTAAVFIAIRDMLSRDIMEKYTYVNYILYANIFVFLGTLLYIVVFNVKLIKPTSSDFWKIIVRLVIVYIIIEPCMFYALKYCKNPGYAKAIIGLNTILIFIIAIVFLKEKMNVTKCMGIGLTVVGSYLLLR
jgi:drug/metabolite transporter (DMT)-like permease